MRKHLCIVAAAALAVGGFAYAGEQQGIGNEPAASGGVSTANGGASSNGNADQSAADRQASSADRNSSAATQPSLTVNDTNARGIRNTMARATDSAASANSFNHLLWQIDQNDRRRIEQDLKGVKMDDLNAAAAQFQRDWKDKYSSDFSVASNSANVFNDSFAQIYQGNYQGEAVTAGARSSPSAAGSASVGTSDNANATTGNRGENNAVVNDKNVPSHTDASGAAKAESGGTWANENHNVGAGTARSSSGNNASNSGSSASVNGSASATDNGTSANGNAAASDQATVIIPASHGLPEVRVPFDKENVAGRTNANGLGDWKIQVPQDLSAQQLHDNILKQLSQLHDQKDSWPSDQTEAFRAVSHRMMAAIENAESNTNPAGQAGATMTPENGSAMPQR